MPPFDYSDAPEPGYDLIPAGTIASVVMRIRPGGVGEDGQLTRSKEGDCEMLVIEYTVADGEYARRKIFENQIIDGMKQGHRDMAQHWYGVRKKILESARNIKKADRKALSPQELAAHLAAYKADLKDFDGLTFIAKIGIEKGKPRKEGGNYDDRNIIAAVITPDQADYRPVVQTPPFNGGGAGGGATPPAPSGPSSPSDPPIEPPPWAR
jgi:hypothetical protein